MCREGRPGDGGNVCDSAELPGRVLAVRSFGRRSAAGGRSTKEQQMRVVEDFDRASHATVVAAFRRRDPDAVRELYRRYGRLVYAVAHRVLGRRDLAEDAVQQTFVNAWQAADRFDVTRDPASWLATIARRNAIDIHRREVRRRALRARRGPDRRPGGREPSAGPRRRGGGVARATRDRRARARRSNDRSPSASRRHDARGDLGPARHRAGNREVAIPPRAPTARDAARASPGTGRMIELCT